MKLWDLPDGWEWKAFDEVANVDSNLVDPGDYEQLPHIAPNHIESGTGRLLPYQTIAEDGVTSSKHLFKPGHILYSKIRPYLAKAVMVDFEGLCSADMYPVSTSLDPQFLHRWLISSTFTAQASQSQGRTVLPKINKKGLGVLKVPVPPPEDQHRIVARIESLQARSRRAKDALDAIPPLLERFRQSVLAAAFRGDLTADWRRKNPDVEPASVLLERIRAERKRRWIDAETEKARSKAEAKVQKAGKPWTEADDRKALEAGRKRAEKRYKEPEPVDPEGLSELPEGWCWAPAESLCSSINDGDHQAPPRADFGVPFVVIGNVSDGQLTIGKRKFVQPDYYEKLDPTRKPTRGDVLYTVTGSFGIPVMVDTDQPFCIQRHIAVLRPLSEIDCTYLQLALAAPGSREQAEQIATGTAQKTVPLRGLRRIALPVPPAREAEALTAKVGVALSTVRTLAAQVQGQADGVERMDAAVLAKAFRGELLPKSGP